MATAVRLTTSNTLNRPGRFVTIEAISAEGTFLRLRREAGEDTARTVIFLKECGYTPINLLDR